MRTVYTNETDWLEARRHGIGSSEAAIITGDAPETWGSKYSLWLNKTHDTPMPGPMGECLYWGKALEPAIAKRVEETTGWTVRNPGDYCVDVHADLDWMRCSIDREIHAYNLLCILECKTANAFRRADWDEGIPPLYRVQIQQQMGVTGSPLAFAACLIGGQELRIFEEPRHDDYIDALTNEIGDFWRHVESGTPPEVDGSDATRKALAWQFPRDNGETIMLPDKALEFDARLQEVKAELKSLNSEEKGLSNWFKNELKNAVCGQIPGGDTYTLGTQVRSGTIKIAKEDLDRAETVLAVESIGFERTPDNSHRVLRRAKPKRTPKHRA